MAFISLLHMARLFKKLIGGLDCGFQIQGMHRVPRSIVEFWLKYAVSCSDMQIVTQNSVAIRNKQQLAIK